MNVSEVFIRRPVTTTLLQIAIVLFGVMGYLVLPVSDLPPVDFPTINVSASLPGADPETMASAIATPLERSFATVSGISSINSTSTMGSTNITIQFDLDRDIDAAAQDVQVAIARTGRQLPPDMPSPPTFRKSNPADFPILFLTLSSETLPLSEVNEYADTLLAQRLSTVRGVAQVSIFGAQKHAVRIDVNPQELAARQIGLNELASAVQTGNSNRPTGTLYGADRTFTVKTDGQLENAASFRRLTVAYRDGRPVTLEQVARVYDGVEDDKTASWYNDARTVYLAVQRQPGSNTVAIVDEVRRLLPSLRAQLPASVQLTPRSDRSQAIRESVKEIKITLGLTVVLVVAVIFLFLRNIRATIIPSLALPASIVGTFAAMYLLDFSIDNMSLMALTLSVGFVVDDAIVMLENIVRHMEHGEDALSASLKASKEIGFTIVSITLSLVAVFIPVLFMGGIVGRLLHEFAVTISIAILISGFVSISLTPMLASRFLKPPPKSHGPVYNAIEKVFTATRDAYGWTLGLAMRFHGVTMAVSVLLLAGTIYCFTIIPTGFIPSQDMGQINGTIEAMQGIGFESMTSHVREVSRAIRSNPNVAAATANVGGGGGGGTMNNGRVTIEMNPAAASRVTREGNRLVVRLEAAGLDLAPPTGLVPELVPAMRAEGAALTIDLAPSVSGYRVDTPEAGRLVIDVLAAGAPPPPPPPKPAATDPPVLELPSAPGNGVRTIVLDPGHGGADVGVMGPGGTREKDLVLDVARRLKAAIENRLGLRVLLTRDDDELVPVDRRTSLANNNKADLFISLHANASKHSDTRGAQVLTLNAAHYQGRLEAARPTDLPVPVVSGGSRAIDMVPWDLAQMPLADASARVADILVRRLTERKVPLYSVPATRLPLRPLVGANMPAVLVELGFLSSARDESALKNPELSAAIVEALVDTIGEVRRDGSSASVASAE